MHSLPCGFCFSSCEKVRKRLSNWKVVCYLGGTWTLYQPSSTPLPPVLFEPKGGGWVPGQTDGQMCSLQCWHYLLLPQALTASTTSRGKWPLSASPHLEKQPLGERWQGTPVSQEPLCSPVSLIALVTSFGGNQFFSVSGTAEPVQFSLVLHEMQNMKRSKRFPIDIYLSSKKFAVQPQVILQAQLSILFSRTHLEDHS